MATMRSPTHLTERGRARRVEFIFPIIFLAFVVVVNGLRMAFARAPSRAVYADV